MTEFQFGRNGARPDVGLDIGPKLAQLQRFQFFDFRALIPALQPGSCFANWLVDVLDGAGPGEQPTLTFQTRECDRERIEKAECREAKIALVIQMQDDQ